MTSVSTIKKDIEEIKNHTNPTKIAIAWLRSNGLVDCSQGAQGTKLLPKEEWEKQMKAQGYNKLILLKFSWDKEAKP